jgi:hypothetical protein
MRHAAPLCLLALLLAGQPTGAQEAAPPIRDVPAGPGTIRGRVVHNEDPERSMGGVTVILYARLQAFGTLMRKNQRRYGGYVVHLGVVFILIGIAGAAFNDYARSRFASQRYGSTRTQSKWRKPA